LNYKYDDATLQEVMLNSAINGTLNVLRSCKKNPFLKRVVLTSSSSTVRIKDEADLPPNVLLDETSWSSIEYCESLQVSVQRRIIHSNFTL